MNGGTHFRRIYQFRMEPAEGAYGPNSWRVMQRIGRANVWEMVAIVFGEERAEIVLDALSVEANEYV